MSSSLSRDFQASQAGVPVCVPSLDAGSRMEGRALPVVGHHISAASEARPPSPVCGVPGTPDAQNTQVAIGGFP
jgi:hypothetical protein